jgi:DNA-binding MarR family transcriptional regulator
MDALQLIRLGRRLTRIGEEALRGGKAPALPNGPSLVLSDVFAHADSSISEIAERTSLPQSYVSESVAKLRDQGMIETRVDSADRRRTLVRVSAEHTRTVARKASTPVDAALAEAVAPLSEDPGKPAAEVLKALESLYQRLCAEPPGPVLEQIEGARPPERG